MKKEHMRNPRGTDSKLHGYGVTKDGQPPTTSDELARIDAEAQREYERGYQTEMRLEIKCGSGAAEVAIELLNEEGEGDGDTSSEGTTIRVCPACGTPSPPSTEPRNTSDTVTSVTPGWLVTDRRALAERLAPWVEAWTAELWDEAQVGQKALPLVESLERGLIAAGLTDPEESDG